MLHGELDSRPWFLTSTQKVKVLSWELRLRSTDQVRSFPAPASVRGSLSFGLWPIGNPVTMLRLARGNRTLRGLERQRPTSANRIPAARQTKRDLVGR